MYYCLSIDNGYIQGVCSSENPFVNNITEDEKNRVWNLLKHKPTPSEGKDYRLKTDLTWEEYDLPVPSEEELDDSEALSIITGEAE